MSLDKVFLSVAVFISVKFVLLFVIPYFICWKWFRNYFKKYKIQVVERQKPQIKFEILYSAMTILIQIILFSLVYWKAQTTNLNLFWGFASQGYLKEFIAVAAYLFLYDAYFYWSHRFLHLPWFYKHVHVVHHRSLNPTPFASFSFHPIETAINLFYFFPIISIFPMSYETFFVLLILTDVSNLAGHLGFDFLPRNSRSQWWGRWLTTPTHHNMHHQFSKSNFGLYWRGWDDYFKTMNPQTEKEFLRIKDQS